MPADGSSETKPPQEIKSRRNVLKAFAAVFATAVGIPFIGYKATELVQPNSNQGVQPIKNAEPEAVPVEFPAQGTPISNPAETNQESAQPTVPTNPNT